MRFLLVPLLTLALIPAHASEDDIRARFEAEIGPLDPAAYALPEVPDEENAALVLVEGAEAMVLEDADEDLLNRLFLKPAAEWTAEDTVRLRELLVRNAGALEILRTAVDRPRSNFSVSYEDGLSAEIPHLLRLLYAAKLVTARARLFWHEGNADSALDDVAMLERFATAQEQQNGLIFLLVGSSVEKYVLSLAREILPDPRLDAESLGRLDSSLPDTDLLAQMRAGVGFIAACVVRDIDDGIEWNREGRKRALGLMGASGAPALRPAGSKAHFYWRVAWASLAGPWMSERYLLNVIQSLEKVGPTFAESSRADLLVEKGLWRNLVPGNDLVDNTDLAHGIGSLFSTLSARRQVRLAIELRLEAGEKGRYPKDLSGFPEAAEDDPLTGGALQYEVLPDGSAVLEVPGALDVFGNVVVIGSAIPLPFRLELPAP